MIEGLYGLCGAMGFCVFFGIWLGYGMEIGRRASAWLCNKIKLKEDIQK